MQFAKNIKEPWSQNLTFSSQKDGSIDVGTLKWRDLLFPNVPLPTPTDFWYTHAAEKPVGAYKGGYGDSEPINRSFIPVLPGACIMHSAESFCEVCTHGILDVINFDRNK